jgi:uncharacterized membrane protein
MFRVRSGWLSRIPFSLPYKGSHGPDLVLSPNFKGQVAKNTTCPFFVSKIGAKVMTRIIKEIEINVPAEKVFNFIADYTNATKYTEHLVRFEPTTEIKRGKGARFDMIGKIFGIPFESQLEVVDFVENRGWRLKPISGTQIEMQWLFRSTEEGTRVTYLTKYRLPFGLIGGIIDGLIVRRVARKATEKTLQKLKDLLEK